MLSKEEHITHWVQSAEEDWGTATYLLSGKQYLMCLFMFHLVIEKLLKAHWIKSNIDNTPPRIHDLQSLFKATELDINGDTYDQLGVMNNWNISTGYPDFRSKMHQICTPEYMEKQRERVTHLRDLLLKKL